MMHSWGSYFVPVPYAENFAYAVRSHWAIENSLHWVLDLSFREDESRIRKDNAPENFAVLRDIALNMIKKETSLKKSIKSKRLRAGWDNNYLLKVLAG
ncbi:MAG: ISAs1 family transposase [Desulfobacterales bacterium]|nr:ISAs1 family transposase [Desulfobacterales bacterium]